MSCVNSMGGVAPHFMPTENHATLLELAPKFSPDGFAVAQVEPGRDRRIHPVYAELFSVLEASGVPYCLIRPAENLAARLKDLDLLIDPARREDVSRLLGA